MIPYGVGKLLAVATQAAQEVTSIRLLDAVFVVDPDGCTNGLQSLPLRPAVKVMALLLLK